MPTTTTNPDQLRPAAGPDRIRKMAERRANTAPLGIPEEDLPPDLPDVRTPQAPAKPIIVLSTTIAYRGRIVTISNEGMTLDAFCDMLDKKFGVAS